MQAYILAGHIEDMQTSSGSQQKVAKGNDLWRSDLRQEDLFESKNSPTPSDGLKTGDTSKNNCGIYPHGTLEGTATYYV